MPGIVPDIVDTMYAAAIENKTAAENKALKEMIHELIIHTPIDQHGTLLAKARALIGMPPAPPLERDYSGIPEHLTAGTTWDPDQEAIKQAQRDTHE